MVQLGLYISPVGFQSGIVPARYQTLYSLNPMVGIIDGFRWSVLGTHSSTLWPALTTAIVEVILLLATGSGISEKPNEHLPTSSRPDPPHMNTAIAIENLGKRYTIGHKKANGDGIRHALERAARHPLTWMKTDLRRRQKSDDFWALRGVSLQIEPGEVVGIVGRNGAGKSTMLKLLSRITVPTEGRIRINGRVGSLLEVGTGFHQELTGRENIFLNGAILGMSRAEVRRKFDEIVAFGEVEEFLDTPVKRYSSGMYVRLAFAVAAHLEPEILIVDEVLAVGDGAFQKKCLNKMGSFANSGRTVLFVSHSMEAVRDLCQRGIWMKDGRVHQDGPAEETIAAYFDEMSGDRPFSCESGDHGLTIHSVILKDAEGQKCSEFHPGDDLIVEIEYEAQKSVDRPYLVLSVHGMSGTCFTANMLLDGNRPRELSGRGKVACRFKVIAAVTAKLFDSHVAQSEQWQ